MDTGLRLVCICSQAEEKEGETKQGNLVYIDGPGILSQANLEYGQNPQSWCHPSLQVLFNFIALSARSHMQNYLKSYMNVLTTL